MKKSIVLLLCLLAFALPLMAGGSQETTASAAGEARPTLNEDGSFHLPIVDEPTTFSIFLNFNNMPFDSSWPVWQELAERTNISFQSVISQSNSNEDEAYNLMLSSGNLADVIGYVNAADLESLGRDGGLIPLNDLIDQYAPNIKAFMEENPAFAQYATSTDGNIYFIPKNQMLRTAEFWFIRQDWLDKLGLEVPTTVDELYDVLTAFRNEDPNGNGLKDEIPLFDRAGWKMPDEYLYLWDTSIEFYVRDGKVVYEPLEENFKTGVTNLVKWYREGLIDPEIFTRGAKSRDTLLASNVGGMTHDWISTVDYNSKLAQDVPGLKIVGIAPPADQNGVVKERTMSYPIVGWGISSQCEDPVSVIKFMDYIFTEEGTTLVNWGIEGVSYYVDENGEKQFTDEALNSDQTTVGFLRSLGALYRIGMNDTGENQLYATNDEGRATIELYNSHPEWYDESQPPYADGELDLKYLPEDETRYERIMGQIKPYVEEKLQSWILGTSDFEADYDSFISELHKRGIDEAIEINQRAYDFYVASGQVD